MTDLVIREEELHDQVTSIIERFRKSWLPDSDDEYYGDTAVEDIIELFESLVAQTLKEKEEELLDFAKDVIGSYGYMPVEGIYIDGGFSTQEWAFSILKRHGLLDKKGRYNLTASLEKEGEKK